MHVLEALKFLLDHNYLMDLKGELVVTNKLKREYNKNKDLLDKMPVGAFKNNISSDVSVSKDVYKQFIIDACVPKKIEMSNGSWFYSNRYSEPANKVFTKIVQGKILIRGQKVDVAKLVEATKRYYKAKNSARTHIGNYFTTGVWESCYEDYIDKHDNTASGDQGGLDDDSSGGNRYERTI
jgi:hypothetical protein